ncbi:Cyclic nucleotide-binding-like [Phytophthora cactorum]|nr:Cyclic nucleotide-binding-like [Phytophthora cactorum]
MSSDPRKGDSQNLAHITNAIMYGIINSILTIPTMYGYAVILFSHKDFEDFMPRCPSSSSSLVSCTSDHFYHRHRYRHGITRCLSRGHGKLKLAALASYLPMPVIGGYLAFIGIFCFYAGLALCTGLVVNDVESMIGVFDNAHDVLLCVPGVLGGAFLLWAVSPWTTHATAAGSTRPRTPPVSELLELFDFNEVHWDQLSKQFGTWIGMVFIVAFSSCLDIAAIELDMGSKLDFNHELKTVGWSNVVSGLLGGYTGSYIFSQTIFTYRSKTNSRIVGVCVIISEFAIVLAPVSVMSYVPRFFFAATLIFIAIDLMIEWLLLTYKKMSLREYAVLWMTFVAVNLVALDEGMLIGVGIAIVNFLLGYIRLPVVSRKRRASGAARTLSERRVLDQKQDAIAYFELSGFLFFGSSVQILDIVQKAVYVRKKLPGVEAGDAGANYLGDADMPLTPHEHRIPLIECLDGTPAINPDAVPTEYVVMDFTNVTAMDATAARSAFLILQKYCSNHDIAVVYAGALPSVRKVLVKNEISSEESFYSSAESALELCEGQLLASASNAKATAGRSSIHHDEGVSELLQYFTLELDDSQVLSTADQFFQKLEVPAGHEFYSFGQPADRFYFLATGCIALDHSRSVESNVVNVLSGSLFGDVDFFGRQQRQAMATATESCVVFEMRRETYEAMQEQNPALYTRIRDVVMQSMATSLSNATNQNTIKANDVAIRVE